MLKSPAIIALVSSQNLSKTVEMKSHLYSPKPTGAYMFAILNSSLSMIILAI